MKIITSTSNKTSSSLLGIRLQAPTTKIVKHWEVQRGDDILGPFPNEKEALAKAEDLLNERSYYGASLVEVLEFTEVRYTEAAMNERKMTGIEYFLSDHKRLTRKIRL